MTNDQREQERKKRVRERTDRGRSSIGGQLEGKKHKDEI